MVLIVILGQSNQGNNKKSSKVAAVQFSPATETDVQPQATRRVRPLSDGREEDIPLEDRWLLLTSCQEQRMDQF
jgi:hypothetical protein